MTAGLDIAGIRAALVARAAAADGVTTALGYMPTKVQAGQLPLVCVGNPEPITYNRTFGTAGHATMTFRVTCLVSAAEQPETATALLDGFVARITDPAATSLAALLRNAQSTTEVPWLFNVRSAEGYGLYEFDSAKFYGVQLVVDVTT